MNYAAGIVLSLVMTTIGTAQVSLSGAVVDRNGAAVSGAQVRLVGAGLTTTTTAQGSFALSGATSVSPALQGTGSIDHSVPATSFYDIRGVRIGTISGTSGVPHALTATANKMTIVKSVRGGTATVRRLLLIGAGNTGSGWSDGSISPSLTKTVASVDTLRISKTGFLTRSIAISSLTGTRPSDTLYSSTFNLGALDQWQNITPPGVRLNDNGIVSVVVDPLHSGTVYTAGYAQGIYKSTDCGSTWVKINTGRNGSVLTTGGQWSMEIDPVNPSVLYAINTYGTNLSLFKTLNGGVDWDPLFLPGSEVAQAIPSLWVQMLDMDPTDHLHIAVTFHNNCSGTYGPMCMAESRDAGATWRLFKGPIGGWGEGAGVHLLDTIRMLYSTPMDGLFYSGNRGDTWARVGAGGYESYRAINGTIYLGGAYGITRSTDNGLSWAAVSGAPNGAGVIGDGKRLFSGWPTCCGNTQPFSTATESIGTDWKTYPSPNIVGARPVYFAYDASVNLLYADVTTAGLWRVVTK